MRYRLSSAGPLPTSQTLFQGRVMEGETQNQVHIDMPSGSVNEGSVKYWLLAAVVKALLD